MPKTEQVRAWLKRLLHPALLIPIMLIAVLSMFIFSFPLHSRNTGRHCRRARARSGVEPDDRLLACPGTSGGTAAKREQVIGRARD